MTSFQSKLNLYQKFIIFGQQISITHTWSLRFHGFDYTRSPPFTFHLSPRSPRSASGAGFTFHLEVPEAQAERDSPFTIFKKYNIPHATHT